MTRQEFAKLADAIKTYYPSDKLLPTKEAMELWYQELKDLEYKTAAVSLRKYVSTNKFPPTIADIRGGVVEVTTEESDWAESWRRVLKAIGAYGYIRQQEAMDSFDDLTRKCVHRLGWKELCMSENVMADRANYRMIYEQLQAKANDEARLPEAVKAEISKLQEQKALEGKHGDSKMPKVLQMPRPSTGLSGHLPGHDSSEGNGGTTERKN